MIGEERMSTDEHRANMAEQKDRVVFDLKDLVASTEALLRSTASYTGAEIEEARSQLKRQLESAQDYAQDWNNTALDAYRRACAAADERVRASPWAFISGALAAGVILGHCLRSDRDRR